MHQPQYLANSKPVGDNTVGSPPAPYHASAMYTAPRPHQPQVPQPPGAMLLAQPPAYLAGSRLTATAWPAAGPDTLADIQDSQSMQELVGGNWIFVVFAPYFVATALQDTHLKVGLVIATVASGLVLLTGLGLWAMNLRKVFPHILEVLMFVIYIVQLGVAYDSEAYEREVVRTYNLITHSALAGTCLASMLVCYPAGYQVAQELVHRAHMRSPAVLRVGLYTTAVLTASLVSSCLLYLVPLCKGFDTSHWHSLNLIFRLIYPCVATFLALLFVRFFPDVYLPNLAVVHGLSDRKTQTRLSPYLTADAASRQPPYLLHNAMYQSTADAVARSLQGATWPPAAPLPPPAAAAALTQQGYAAGAAGSAAHQTAHQGPPWGPMGPPLAVGPGGVGPSLELAGEVWQQYPRQDPNTPLYTHFRATGPPAPPPPPPLAVFAVYREGAMQAPQPHSSSSPATLPAAGPGLLPAHTPPPPQQAVAARMPLYAEPPRHHTNAPAAAAAAAAAAAPSAHRYMSHPQAVQGRMGAASSGGAGPYGVNLPLSALAGGIPAGSGADWQQHQQQPVQQTFQQPVMSQQPYNPHQPYNNGHNVPAYLSPQREHQPLPQQQQQRFATAGGNPAAAVIMPSRFPPAPPAESYGLAEETAVLHAQQPRGPYYDPRVTDGGDAGFGLGAELGEQQQQQWQQPQQRMVNPPHELQHRPLGMRSPAMAGGPGDGFGLDAELDAPAPSRWR
ncbi:hypothetical protein Agub_g3232 [Astrephomene gubernaculifera]|uniref:Uncharacterized protein n=1 Tax=Astrephomene gubernaculifera TaxID=47775 RepID=A0AAD3DIA6_9CHLO|nr:hypothetical protein Agub_g3232 [Astrephomene gubernaculifera]